jgi:hypothetical protein
MASAFHKLLLNHYVKLVHSVKGLIVTSMYVRTYMHIYGAGDHGNLYQEHPTVHLLFFFGCLQSQEVIPTVPHVCAQ